MLCAELVEVQWREQFGPARTATAILEDISPFGGCLQFEVPVPLGVEVRVAHGDAELRGLVRYCTFREIGYFVGIEFREDSQWSRRNFEPQHLLDLRRLVESAIQRATERRESDRLQ